MTVVAAETGAPVQGASVEVDRVCCESGRDLERDLTRAECTFKTNSAGKVQFAIEQRLTTECRLTIIDAQGRLLRKEVETPECNDVRARVELPGAVADAGVEGGNEAGP